jgi:hypothetical protein
VLDFSDRSPYLEAAVNAASEVGAHSGPRALQLVLHSILLVFQATNKYVVELMLGKFSFLSHCLAAKRYA